MGQLHRLLALDVPPNGFAVPPKLLNRPLCFNNLSKRFFNADRTNKLGLRLSPSRVSHVCKMSGSDMISQLEIGRPEERRKQGKRVNGIFWILLLNIGVYMADHLFHVLFRRSKHYTCTTTGLLGTSLLLQHFVMLIGVISQATYSSCIYLGSSLKRRKETSRCGLPIF